MSKLSLLSLSAIVVSSYQAEAKQNPKTTQSPNLVIIIADQWRGTALGMWGVEPVLTPNIDALASEGIAFREAVSSYTVSSPARAMLMTGMYSFKNKVTENCYSLSEPYGVELQQSAVCWSDVLNEKGYDLGYLGKWHLDSPRRPYIKTYNNREDEAWNEWCPPERRHGFDHWIAYGTYDSHLRPMYWTTDDKRDGWSFVDQWGPEFEADRAIEYIGQDRDNPFALVVSMNPPHTGYDLYPERYKGMYDHLDIDSMCNEKPSISPKGTKWGDHYRRNIKDYYSCMSGVDEQVGRIVQELKDKGLFDNTIIVFTSDHGDCIGAHEEVTKGNFYEESMNVPMIITYPPKINPRIDTMAQMGFQDIYPTVLSLMGFEKAIPKSVETQNFADYILGRTSKSVEWQPYMRLKPENLKSGVRGIRSLKYTFALEYDDTEVIKTTLFDNVNDPFQLTNIASQFPELCKAFTKQMARIFKPMGDPLYSY